MSLSEVIYILTSFWVTVLSVFTLWRFSFDLRWHVPCTNHKQVLVTLDKLDFQVRYQVEIISSRESHPVITKVKNTPSSNLCDMEKMLFIYEPLSVLRLSIVDSKEVTLKKENSQFLTEQSVSFEIPKSYKWFHNRSRPSCIEKYSMNVVW